MAVQIEQTGFEKAMATILFFLSLATLKLILPGLIDYHKGCSSSFKSIFTSIDIKVRRPKYLLLAYSLILPWIFEEAIAIMILYYDKKDRSSPEGQSKWTYSGGTSPIFYTQTADTTLHFLFWFSFWSFIQLKVFKLQHLKYLFVSPLFTEK